MEKIKVGISTCLLGERVRYDGGHKLDRFIRETLGRFFEFVPVCPEHEAGFGTPREAFRLVGDPAAPRLITQKSGIDHTERMLAWCRKRLDELEAQRLCGFIFKAKSPSSGMERVKVYGEKGMPAKVGVGLWAAAFMERFPLLPVEEEGRLHDLPLRENFIQRVFAMNDLRALLDGRRTRGALVAFHTRYKLLLRAHSPVHYRELGRLAAAPELPAAELFRRYQEGFLAAFRMKTTRKKHLDCLHHIQGFFKEHLSADEKAELLELFENFREGLVPLIVPITLLNHFVRKYDQPYLKEQLYLNPLPLELQLRNHV